MTEQDLVDPWAHTDLDVCMLYMHAVAAYLLD